MRLCSCVTLLALLCTSLVNALCYLDGSPGIQLDHYLDPTTQQISCKPGFLCPFFDPLNSTTYPVACPVSPECYLSRLFSAECDESPGLYEPVVCPSGHYCPKGANDSIPCPEDTYCLVGSVSPGACPALATCDGSDRYKNNALLIGMAIAVLLVTTLCIVYEKFLRYVAVESADVEGEQNNVNLVGKMQQGNMSNGADSLSPRGESNSQGSMSGSASGGGVSPNGSLTGSMSTSSMKPGTLSELVKGFRRARGDHPPLCFDFENLCVSIEVPTEGSSPSTTAKSKKMLLEKSSGSLEPGGVTAIMGPSGSGKSTLMNTLLGRLDPRFRTAGTVMVNGVVQSELPRHSIGFVPQDDVLHQELTVYKNIKYSSDFRCPVSWSFHQKKEFVAAVLSALSLTDHQNTAIGTEHERGVSGGQRKRASIGLELAAAPLAMFLDEPTSGLDSTTSLELVAVLKSIAMEADLTVAMVIHQPRVEIWNGLDRVLLLAKGGRTVFQGLQRDAQPYFQHGRPQVKFISTANPADVIMDAIVEQGSRLASLWEKECPDVQSRRRSSLGASFLPASMIQPLPESIVSDGLEEESEQLSSHLEDAAGVLTSGDSDARKQRASVGSSTEFSRVQAFDQDQAETENVESGQPTTITQKLAHSQPTERDDLEVVTAEPSPAEAGTTLTPPGSRPRSPTNPLVVHNGDSDGNGADRGDQSLNSSGVFASEDSKPSEPKQWDLGSLRSGQYGKLTEPIKPGFLRQVLLNHNRYVEKQIVTYRTFITETFVMLLCASVLAFAWTNFSYKGVYVLPYREVSPKPQVALAPQMHMYAAMSISLGAAPAGYGVFGYHRETYFREAGSGHNRVAYFVGTLLATVPRILLVTLFFATWYYWFAGFTFSFNIFYWNLFLLVWGCYCSSIMISVFIQRKYGLLVAQVFVVLMGIFNGFVKNFPNEIKYFSVAYHYSNVFQWLLHDGVKHVYEPQFEEWGYRDVEPAQPLLFTLLISVVYLVIAIVGLLKVDKQRQR